jgi:hypothetical protein
VILKLREKLEEVYFTLFHIFLGSYGVVFKGIKKDPNDLDDNGKKK